MDLKKFPISIKRDELRVQVEGRLEYLCEHCGFTGIARVFGRGRADRTGTIDEVHVEEEAHANARSEGDVLLGLRSCPQCGKRNGENAASFQRETWLHLGLAGIGIIYIWYRYLKDSAPSPIVRIIFLIISIAVLCVIAHFRRRQSAAADKRVTFLSAEELAVEAEEAAIAVAEREAARRARARQQRAPAKKRSRFK